MFTVVVVEVAVVESAVVVAVVGVSVVMEHAVQPVQLQPFVCSSCAHVKLANITIQLHDVGDKGSPHVNGQSPWSNAVGVVRSVWMVVVIEVDTVVPVAVAAGVVVPSGVVGIASHSEQPKQSQPKSLSISMQVRLVVSRKKLHV